MSYVITKDDLISEVAKNSPKAVELLTEYGLHCANCFLNTFDTIESGGHVHGMTDEEIIQMIQEINTELKKSD